MSDTLIVIPARYQSTRFPGKPLAKIAGRTLLQRVCDIALNAAQQLPNIDVLVATDDERILEHAHSISVKAVLTPANCATGTDRILAAISELPSKPQAVINLQGDAPLTPVTVLTALIKALTKDPAPKVVTPVLQLSWSELDILRQAKIEHPFSGTTVIINKHSEALWFSKQIIPALRNESSLRSSTNLSPIYQHLGIYGYSVELLEAFSKLPQGHYEQLEGLEQLRFLENGYKITAVPVALDNLLAWRGVDTVEDAKFVEHVLSNVN